jgi:hypothetical protein
MQTFLASPQHVAADHLGRFASRVRLAVLARRNPSAREEDSQATTLNSNRHYNQNDFRFECSADAIYLYYYIVKDQNSNRRSSHCSALVDRNHTPPTAVFLGKSLLRMELGS